jgi:hypothetical protein
VVFFCTFCFLTKCKLLLKKSLFKRNIYILERYLIIAVNNSVLGMTTETIKVTDEYIIISIINSARQIFFIHKSVMLHPPFNYCPRLLNRIQFRRLGRQIHNFITFTFNFSYHWLGLIDRSINLELHNSL